MLRPGYRGFKSHPGDSVPVGAAREFAFLTSPQVRRTPLPQPPAVGTTAVASLADKLPLCLGQMSLRSSTQWPRAPRVSARVPQEAGMSRGGRSTGRQDASSCVPGLAGLGHVPLCQRVSSVK